jgi:hypothetical protein
LWNPRVILVAAGILWLLAAMSLLARSGAATRPLLPAAVAIGLHGAALLALGRPRSSRM